MIDITRAQAIPGWMKDPELTWLAEQAQTHRAIVELGSYVGRSTRALGDHTEGKVLAVDHWKGPRHVVCDKEQLLKKFYHNLRDLILAGRVRYLVSDHGSVPEIDFSPDMIFIDGDHDYESVHRDITVWRERLAPGGLLCGHDFTKGFPGVRKAVEELLPTAKFAPDTSIWFVEALA